MPNSPRAVQRRIRWIVALIVFMLALGAVYMVMMGAHRTHAGHAPVNVVSPAS